MICFLFKLKIRMVTLNIDAGVVKYSHRITASQTITFLFQSFNRLHQLKIPRGKENTLTQSGNQTLQ